MMAQRKVAQVVWGAQGGKPGEFDDFWPLPGHLVKEKVVKVWGTKDDMEDFKKQIEKAHGIKLS